VLFAKKETVCNEQIVATAEFQESQTILIYLAKTKLSKAFRLGHAVSPQLSIHGSQENNTVRR